MEQYSEGDFIRVPRPRSLLSAVLMFVRARTTQRIARERGHTIAAVAEVLRDSGRNGTVVSRQKGDQWSVAFSSTDALALSATEKSQHL
ncbi:hypothetical protein [Actinophytocola oryzae]|uniref:Uncharacterized protein n=1 Tax=Actinophytocola oryzae TaxID=502181 RepID=A0A4R7V9C4_9PSEU|nr:hypothetical protein [Actinophytocola oryzae]TDV45536.1 hypothetical protein CLV71_112205 [Actinophytocola oryzae]